MKVSITPLGARSGDGGTSVTSIVDYLTGKKPSERSRQPIDGDDPSALVNYFGSSIEGPGVWQGSGARAFGLDGEVRPDDLKVLLMGRHHVTGDRLLSASGSAGRKSLKVGEPSRWIDQQPMWDLRDAAGRFDVSDNDFHEIATEAGIDIEDTSGLGWTP